MAAGTEETRILITTKSRMIVPTEDSFGKKVERQAVRIPNRLESGHYPVLPHQSVHRFYLPPPRWLQRVFIRSSMFRHHFPGSSVFPSTCTKFPIFMKAPEAPSMGRFFRQTLATQDSGQQAYRFDFSSDPGTSFSIADSRWIFAHLRHKSQVFKLSSCHCLQHNELTMVGCSMIHI